MNGHSIPLRIVALLVAGLLAASQPLIATAEPVWPSPAGIPGVTKQQQEHAGLKIMDELYQQMPVLPDSSSLAQYVRQLGHKLQMVIPHQHSWPYQFHVIPRKEVSAFALPGGPIFITAGTIMAAGNEAELAGVMAHEMAHVYMEHAIKQQRIDTLPSILDDAGAMLGGMLAGMGAVPQTSGQTGTGMFLTKYSRADEIQADAVGAMILYQAGYKPQALAGFFKKLEQQRDSPPQFLSDHPNPGNREAAILREIADWPEKPSLENSPQFVAAQDQAKGIRTYTAREIDQDAKSGLWARQNAQQGAIPANAPTGASPVAATGSMRPQKIKVSGTFKRLLREGYRISYPDNWQVLGERQSPSASIVPPDGFTQDAIAYGVVINHFSPLNPNEPLEQAATDLIHSIQEQTPELEVTGAPHEVTVAMVHGRSVDLLGTSPVQQNGKPEPEHDWLVAVPQTGGGLLYLVFVSPEPDFEHLRPTFERMLKTLQLH
jgi:Zn-dependent protease with chaperone function